MKWRSLYNSCPRDLSGGQQRRILQYDSCKSNIFIVLSFIRALKFSDFTVFSLCYRMGHFWKKSLCCFDLFKCSLIHLCFQLFYQISIIKFQCRPWLLYFLHIWTGVKKFLLYARRSEIRGVDIDNPYHNLITALTVPDIEDVTAMDYDAVDERIYWADVKTRTIKRVFINGTKLETVMFGGRVRLSFSVSFVVS